MKKILMMSVLASAIACSQLKDKSPPTPMDQQSLSRAEKSICSAGERLQQAPGTTRLYNVGPSIITFIKGEFHCALEDNYNEGGIATWLGFNFFGPCLENNSLWVITRNSVEDSIHLYVDMVRWEGPSEQWIHIHTNYDQVLSEMNSKVGMVAYTCTPTTSSPGF